VDPWPFVRPIEESVAVAELMLVVESADVLMVLAASVFTCVPLIMNHFEPLAAT
jgi:hypothetical protein